jgi:hypothetical protein
VADRIPGLKSSASVGEIGQRGPGAHRPGGPGRFTVALAESLARYRYVIGLAAVVLLVLALLPTRGRIRPRRASPVAAGAASR